MAPKSPGTFLSNVNIKLDKVDTLADLKIIVVNRFKGGAREPLLATTLIYAFLNKDKTMLKQCDFFT